MALADVQAIHQAISDLVAQRLENQRLALAKANQESEAKYREQEGKRAEALIEQQKQDLEFRKNQFDKSQALQKAIADFQHIHDLRDLNGKLPANQLTNGGLDIPSFQNEGQTIHIPMQSLEEALSIHQREAKEASDLEQGRQIAIQGALEKSRAAAEKELEGIRQAGENHRAELQRGVQLKIAGLDNSPEGNDVINSIVNHISNGEYTADDVAKLGGQGKAALRIASHLGIVPLSKQQQQSLVGIQNAAGIIPLMDQFNSSLPDTGNIFTSTGAGIMSHVQPSGEVNRIAGQLESQMPIISTGIMSEGKRLSNLQLELNKGIIPGRNDTTANRVAKRNGFYDAVRRDFDANLSNLSPGQRAAIFTNRGLDKFGYTPSLPAKPNAQTVNPPNPGSIESILGRYGLPTGGQ